MDARITKQRLSNQLSYDWIKILALIAAAVTAICVLFTMIATRAGRYQVFSVYGYGNLRGGADSTGFAERLRSAEIFSYDVLEVESETFDTSSAYADMTFLARRTAGQGTAMFVSSEKTGNADAPDETWFDRAAGTGKECVALDLEIYLSDCENYLKRFFGEEYRTGELSEKEAEACFMKRNGKDRRYRFEEKRAEGILAERERLLSLREDYLFVQSCLQDGTLSFFYRTDGEEETARAFLLTGLTNLSQLYSYSEERDGKTVWTSAGICLFLFRNDGDAGRPAGAVGNDLRYEPLSFVRYLVERYR